MTRSGDIFSAHQRARFMRPDASRYLRADEARWQRPPHPDEIKYSPDQPRDERGRWTDQTGTAVNPFGFLDPDSSEEATSEVGSDGGGLSAFSAADSSATMFDIDPDAVGQPGDELAQNRRAGGLSTQFPEATPAQMLRLDLARSEADAAIGRVRELEPGWQPNSSLYQSVEGAISAAQGETLQAQTHVNELAQRGIGPGPYAVGSIPARGVSRNFSADETRENNTNGDLYGCHTCGTNEPGTFSGNWIRDHQYPSALNSSVTPQRIYPQCATCSSMQGGFVTSLKGLNK